MEKKLISSVIITTLLFIISVQMISSEIIWSLPSGVEFTTVNSSNNELILTVISPINKTYTIKNIPLEIKTNIESTCTYSLDNLALNTLGTGDRFFKNLLISNGNHKIKITCKSGNQEKTSTVYFKVNCPTKPKTNQSIDYDLEYENYLRTPVYTEWICYNNRFQRTVTINNLQEIEYGQTCGLEIPASIRDKKSSILWLLPLIFIILILIAIVLITLTIIRSR